MAALWDNAMPKKILSALSIETLCANDIETVVTYPFQMLRGLGVLPLAMASRSTHFACMSFHKSHVCQS